MQIRPWTLGVAMFTLFLVTPASADSGWSASWRWPQAAPSRWRPLSEP